MRQMLKAREQQMHKAQEEEEERKAKQQEERKAKQREERFAEERHQPANVVLVAAMEQARESGDCEALSEAVDRERVHVSATVLAVAQVCGPPTFSYFTYPPLIPPSAEGGIRGG